MGWGLLMASLGLCLALHGLILALSQEIIELYAAFCDRQACRSVASGADMLESCPSSSQVIGLDLLSSINQRS